MDGFQQEQFLHVLEREEADRRFRAVLDLSPLEAEVINLSQAWGRVLAKDIASSISVPGFDRSNVDGFALLSQDTFGVTESEPCSLQLHPESITPGRVPQTHIEIGHAVSIATGGMLPRGADAIVMIEHTDLQQNQLIVKRPVSPGSNISFAGSDIAIGEMVLCKGELLSSRETGVLAAIGANQISVVRRPQVAILSTGDELVPAGQPLPTGSIYDSNSVVLADAVRECGAEPIPLGIVPDDLNRLRQTLQQAMQYDVILLSGGTSKGAGDLSYRVIQELGQPGLIAHGIALKPGKPLCLAAYQQDASGIKYARPKPLAILPGFPTSAIFTFHEFLAPVIRCLAGLSEHKTKTLSAKLPTRIRSEFGRTEFLLVGLSPKSNKEDLLAYPLGKGSGSVTAFARADGYIVIPSKTEYMEAEETVSVHLLSSQLDVVDLVGIGSHCLGLDFLLSLLRERGFRAKYLTVGSQAGVEAIRREECDLAGIHLLDPKTNRYNQNFVPDNALLVKGYGRLQGILFRLEDSRFMNRSLEEVLSILRADSKCQMVNRNRGSGTRILIDGLLQGVRPSGYLLESRSHQAVGAAIAQNRADWGVAIEQVAQVYQLGFLALQEECYDFLIPQSRLHRPVVQTLLQILQESMVQQKLQEMGFGTLYRNG